MKPPLRVDRQDAASSLLRLEIVILCLLILPLARGATAGISEAETNTVVISDTVSTLRERLAEAKSESEKVRPAEGKQLSLFPEATQAEAAEYMLLSDSLVRTYQQHLDELGRLEATRRRLKEDEQAARTWAGFAEPAPYSLLLVDDLRDTVESLTAKIQGGGTTVKILEQISADWQASLAESDGRLRQIAEELESAKGDAGTARLTWQRTLEQARNRVASALAALNETRRKSLQAEMGSTRQRLALAQRKLVAATQSVRFSQQDLDQVMKSLDAERSVLESELRKAELENEQKLQGAAITREELKNLAASGAGAAANNPDRAGRAKELEAALALLKIQVETSAARLITLRQMLDIAIYQRTLWRMRFETFGARDSARFRDADMLIGRLSRMIQVAKPFFLQQVELSGKLATEQRNRLQNRAGIPGEAAQAREFLECYERGGEVARRALFSLQEMERLILRWNQALEQHRKALPFLSRVRDLFSDFSSFAGKLWHFELFAAEDTITVDGQTITGRRSVTIGKVVAAVFILAVGFWLTRLLGRLLERFAVKRLKVEPNQANLIRRWTRVVLVLALVVFALVSVKIPLTVFAFLGGALAIGLGFGTQNLLKNFISGIIILFERPFRVGDVLDIQGRRGTVTGIGIRSSVLQLWDGTETLIPNSVLLENNLTNWTYSNRRVRFSVSVTVPFGADTRRVEKLLGDVVARHALVENEPPPQVYLKEFAANAFNFEARYWVDVLKHNAAQISSELRHMIANVLAEDGINMSLAPRGAPRPAEPPAMAGETRPQPGPQSPTGL